MCAGIDLFRTALGGGLEGYYERIIDCHRVAEDLRI